MARTSDVCGPSARNESSAPGYPDRCASRRIAYLPSYTMTCDEQMSRMRHLFHDHDHAEAGDDA